MDRSQAEADELGAQTNERFAGFSPVLAELLKDASFRPADIIFEDEITLDLGGVHVRVLGVGPNHTRGDTVFFVEEDPVRYTGDVVMSVFPAVSAQSGSIAKWIANMGEFEALNPAAIVPAHGRLGDAAFVRRYRDTRAVQSRVAQAKRGGATVEQATAALAEPLAKQFPELAPASGPAAGRVNAAIQAAYRERRDGAHGRVQGHSEPHAGPAWEALAVGCQVGGRSRRTGPCIRRRSSVRLTSSRTPAPHTQRREPERSSRAGARNDRAGRWAKG